MQKYLYLLHENDFDSIKKSLIIDNRKSTNSNFESGGFVVDNNDKKIIAYIYEISEIKKSGCYITYPLEHLGFKTNYVRTKIFGFIPFFKTVETLIIPPELKAIVFDIEDDFFLEKLYLYDYFLEEKLYCETVSSVPLMIKNLEEISIKTALQIIGMEEPYQHFIDTFKKRTGISITEDYLIDY